MSKSCIVFPGERDHLGVEALDMQMDEFKAYHFGRVKVIDGNEKLALWKISEWIEDRMETGSGRSMTKCELLRVGDYLSCKLYQGPLPRMGECPV